MVDINQIGQAQALIAQKQQLLNAIEIFNRPNGKITAMVAQLVPEPVENGNGTPQVPEFLVAQIDTSQFTYPQQMVEGIKQQVQQRLHAIEDELAAMGISGIEPSPRGTAAHAQATRAAARRK
jgi:hypothetical protein